MVEIRSQPEPEIIYFRYVVDITRPGVLRSLNFCYLLLSSAFFVVKDVVWILTLLVFGHSRPYIPASVGFKAFTSSLSYQYLT
jgi:hypothetical protein